MDSGYAQYKKVVLICLLSFCQNITPTFLIVSHRYNLDSSMVEKNPTCPKLYVSFPLSHFVSWSSFSKASLFSQSRGLGICSCLCLYFMPESSDLVCFHWPMVHVLYLDSLFHDLCECPCPRFTYLLIGFSLFVIPS